MMYHLFLHYSTLLILEQRRVTYEPLLVFFFPFSRQPVGTRNQFIIWYSTYLKLCQGLQPKSFLKCCLLYRIQCTELKPDLNKLV